MRVFNGPFLCQAILNTTYLFAILLEEPGRVHAVGDGAADKGEEVEDHGRLILVLEQQLLGDVEADRQGNEAANEEDDLAHDALGAKLLDERVARRNLEDTHVDCGAMGETGFVRFQSCVG